MNFQTVCIVHDAVPHCSVTVLVFQMFICPILIIREHVSITYLTLVYQKGFSSLVSILSITC